MEYNLIIGKKYADPEYNNGLKQWRDVTAILRNGLDQWTISVHIYKYSSDNRLLGEKHVTMGNHWDMTKSLTDKVLL